MTMLLIFVLLVSLSALLVFRVRQASNEWNAAQVRLRRAQNAARDETQRLWSYK